MSTWRKKPVVIEAFRWTGGKDQTEDPAWMCQALLDGKARFEHVGTLEVSLLIETLEGTHRANRGDWIIRGIKGELYPIKDSIFRETYDPVEDAQTI